jgi:hypothetical protein
MLHFRHQAAQRGASPRASTSLCRLGRVRKKLVLAGTLASMAAQLAFRWPILSYLLWGVIAAAGAATVLSYAIRPATSPEKLPAAPCRAQSPSHGRHLRAPVGRRVQHRAVAQADRSYPVEAHQAAPAIGLALQLATLLWFAAPRHGSLLSMQHAVARMVLDQPRPITATCPYTIPVAARSAQIALAQRQVVRWRRAAAASASVCMALITGLAVLVVRGDVAPQRRRSRPPKGDRDPPSTRAPGSGGFDTRRPSRGQGVETVACPLGREPGQ